MRNPVLEERIKQFRKIADEDRRNFVLFAIFLSIVLLYIFAFTGRKIARWEGGILLAAYFLYMGLRFELIPTFGG